MSNLNNRLSRLEDERAPKDQVIYVVVYDPATGRATDKSSPELIGLTREEIQVKLSGSKDQKTVLLNVVRRNDATAVYLPDNGRGGA